MSKLWRLKLIAFSIHALFSVVIISIFMLFVTQLWFPDILFSLENVWQGLQILIPVHAILGPLLTLILFVPGKKGLIGDLITITTIQLLALVYGAYAIYGQRPEVIVFAGDRFEIIPSSKFDRENFAEEFFHGVSIPYPHIVYSLPAQTDKEQEKFILENVQYQKMSERYRPLKDYRDAISIKALALSKIVPSNEQSKANLEAFKEQYTNKNILLFVLEGTTTQAKIIILDNNSLENLGYLDIDPWTDYIP